MVLVDFDWAGEEGKAFYPTGRLNEELLRGRTSDDLMIRKDDKRVSENTLAKVLAFCRRG